ncbi:FAD/NAD(P)-binding domain-containing protein [Pholiota conissans]|uniref:FAD/NAD(P)-binding domain-containing protein n=1 Tax=Pholiota conissans TaxID=109636 RepID=A0A9P6CWT4_9AGAR|nr:FAD/NAD(P)-binding domain-containing protein [Pholiota conissans]
MPTDTKSRDNSKVQLKFIVAGAGISGLAVAATLRKAGHDVLVVEKSNGKIRSKGGIQSPPNMTKLLHKWGLGPNLKERAHKCDRFFFSNGGTGDLIGCMNMGEGFLGDLSADFLFLQHRDLYNMLYQLAVKEGVEFRFNSTIVDADNVAVSVTLDSEEVLYADVIIGADGFDSLLRQVVTDSGDEPPDVTDTHVIATFLIPVHLMEDDEDLRMLLNARNWHIWLGNGYVMNANMLVGEKDFTVTIIHHYDGPRYPGDLNWTEERTLESLGIHMKNFDPILQRLLKLATSVSSRIYVRRPVPEDFVCANSRVVLVGESAHPMLPASNHGVALILEDAQTLGLLFSRIRNRDQIPQLLTAYEEIRHPYTAEVWLYDHEQRRGMKAPLGPEQQMRDAILSQTMASGHWDHMDDSPVFRQVWGNELRLWTYDPTDKVEDWWGQYGSFIMRRHDRSSMEVTDISFS